MSSGREPSILTLCDAENKLVNFGIIQPMERERRTNSPESNEQYLNAILSVDRLCKMYDLDHRFVGGTLTDLISPRTKATFDFENRRVHLKDYNQPQMFRADGTIKDMDLVSFRRNSEAFEDGKETLGEKEQGVKKQGLPFPHISIEPIKTPANPRNPSLQLVSGFESDEHQDLFLTFDHIRQKIDRETVKPWRIVLTDDFGVSFVTLNPYAHALRYLMRVPSGMKGKDKELKRENGQIYNKMSPYVNLALLFDEAAQAQGIDITALYKPWIDFILKMRDDPSPRIRAKRLATGTYWDTVGTALAHGRGIFEPLSKLGDRFTG